MKNLAKAVLQVMAEVKGMEKNSRVGSGGSAYDGTKDQDVKEIFNDALQRNGLCILPTDIQETTQIDRWEEIDQWSKAVPKAIKQKQSVFTKVVTKYLLLHESGESQVLSGYGHGIDPQDKGAGKATTYALKNLLLYTFLTPVGKIDDTDLTHSNDVATPQKAQPEPTTKPIDLDRLNARLNACATIDELGKTFKAFSPIEQKATSVLATKLKKDLTPKK